MRSENENNLPKRVRFKRWIRRHSTIIIFSLGLIAVLLSIIGFYCDQSITFLPKFLTKIITTFYNIARLFTLNHSFESSTADGFNHLIVLAAFIVTIFVFLTILSLIIYAFTGLRLKCIDLLHMLFRRKIVVICGLGRIGNAIVSDCVKTESGRNVSIVVIEKDPQNPHIQTCRDKGIIVLIGDATEQDLLLRARANKALRVFVVTGSDTHNIEVVMKLFHYCGGDKVPVCYLHVIDPIQAQLVEDACRIEKDNTCLNLPKIKTFNIYRDTARQFVNKYLPDHSPDAEQILHFTLFGFGPMAQALALQLVRQAHFINQKRLRMTIYTEDADKRSFLARYPAFCPEPGTVDWANLSESVDNWNCSTLRPSLSAQASEDFHNVAVEYACNAEFKEIPANLLPSVLDDLTKTKPENSVDGPIIVCFEDERRNFETAIELKEMLQRRPIKPSTIYAWLPRLTGLADLLDNLREKSSDFTKQNTNQLSSPQIITFGKTDDICRIEEILQDRMDVFASMIHGAHQELVDREDPERAASSPIETWEALSREHRESNRQQYDHMDIKLRSMGYHRVPEDSNEETAILEFTNQQIEVLSKIEHNRWIAERLLAGYKYAPPDKRDDRALLHPDLVPWEQLTEHSKEYDRKAVGRIPHVLSRVGEKIIQMPSARKNNRNNKSNP